MKCEFQWSESGLQLLQTIQSYIDQHGGNKALLIEIDREDREIRKAMYKDNCLTGGNVVNWHHRRFKIFKEVILTKDRQSITFKSVTDAANYIGVDKSRLAWSNRRGTKCLGYKVHYTGNTNVEEIYVKDKQPG